MKKTADVLKAVCAVASAVLIYLSANEAALGGEKVIVYVIACIFAISTTVLCFAVSDLEARVKNLEDTLGIYVDKGYEPEEIEKKVCAKCSAEIDADYVICPFCGNRDEKMLSGEGNPYVERIHAESESGAQAQDESYGAVDHSDEEIVSANFDPEDYE